MNPVVFAAWRLQVSGQRGNNYEQGKGGVNNTGRFVRHAVAPMTAVVWWSWFATIPSRRRWFCKALRHKGHSVLAEGRIDLPHSWCQADMYIRLLFTSAPFL